MPWERGGNKVSGKGSGLAGKGIPRTEHRRTATGFRAENGGPKKETLQQDAATQKTDG